MGNEKKNEAADPRSGPRGNVRAASLPLRWILLQGAALLLLAAGTTWLLQRGENIEESQRLTSKSHSLAQLLAQAAGPDYSAGDSERLLRVLECATRGGDLRAAAIVDDGGTILAHTDVSRIGSSLGAPLPPGPIPEEESALLSVDLFGGNEGSVVLHPLLGSGGIRGTAALLLLVEASGASLVTTMRPTSCTMR